MRGNFRAGAGKSHLARNFSKIRQILLFSEYFLLQISTKNFFKRVQVSLAMGFYDATYQNLRSIFTTARKIFLEKWSP